MPCLYLFQIEKWEQSSKVCDRHGTVIGFVDNRTFSQEEVWEMMHIAYELGEIRGQLNKAEKIKKVLGI